MTMIDREPGSREEIVAALEEVRARSRTYWESFAPAAFVAPLGEAWSPADNVRHLNKSVSAVAGGLRVPKLLLRLRFGRAKAPSRTYAGLREHYRTRLAQGADAGRYGPSSPLDAGGDPAAARDRILAQHDEAVQSLIEGCARWSEKALDGYVLPHPLLGPLTVREMLFFTVYHNQHHVAVVQRRVAG